ncbi:hypothetical protein KBTX_03756 [wastewater metagenome]|uniref:Uncharacterized protein n=2 Tax=unclassified sequences TaxID=12908 RepID=A0A5B8RFP6_9ZZZZ|nr:hypothetical protein KBTEX_03756 [uncultured organism]
MVSGLPLRRPMALHPGVALIVMRHDRRSHGSGRVYPGQGAYPRIR